MLVAPIALLPYSLTPFPMRILCTNDDGIHATGLAVLEKIALTPEKLQERITPEMRKATYKVPRSGLAAGTAANFALHLAQC